MEEENLKCKENEIRHKESATTTPQTKIKRNNFLSKYNFLFRKQNHKSIEFEYQNRNPYLTQIQEHNFSPLQLQYSILQQEEQIKRI